MLERLSRHNTEKDAQNLWLLQLPSPLILGLPRLDARCGEYMNFQIKLAPAFEFLRWGPRHRKTRRPIPMVLCWNFWNRKFINKIHGCFTWPSFGVICPHIYNYGNTAIHIFSFNLLSLCNMKANLTRQQDSVYKILRSRNKIPYTFYFQVGIVWMWKQNKIQNFRRERALWNFINSLIKRKKTLLLQYYAQIIFNILHV